MIPIPLGPIAKLIEWYARRHTDKKVWKVYQELLARQKGNPARLLFKPTSEGEAALYEQMVAKGLLARDQPGMYYLAGR